MIEVELIGCGTYTADGSRYVADRTYLVSENTADLLLGRVNDKGLRFFKKVSGDTIEEEEEIMVVAKPAPRAKAKSKAKAGRKKPAQKAQEKPEDDSEDDSADRSEEITVNI